MASDHTVRAGEGMAKIALQYGFLPDALWNHPSNSKLKEQRRNPEILNPGDVVHIPDKTLKEVRAASDQRHRFRKKGLRAVLQIRMMHGETPRADESYLIEIDGHHTITGKTDVDGWIRTTLTPGATSGKLILQQGEEYQLQFGHIDSIDSVSGAQSRLRNLGFYHGAVDDKASDEFTAAVKAFQADKQISETGRMDEATRAALVAAHGS